MYASPQTRTIARLLPEGEKAEGKDGQVDGGRRRPALVVRTQCSIRMMCYRVMHFIPV